MTVTQPVWPLVDLGQIAQFRNGLNYSRENFGKGLKVINVKDFGDRTVPDYDSLDEICPDRIVREESYLADGDILFVRSNGNPELIGRSMIMRCSPKQRLSHSAFTIRARFHSDLALPRFFSYVFRTPLIRSVLSAQGNGANISNLNQDILTRLRVPLPDIKTQRRITSILSAYDDLIENNTRRIAILEEMARRIYEEWFVYFRFPGHEKVRMVESELVLIPEGWRVRKLSDFGAVITGKTPSKADPNNFGTDTPFIKTPDMHGNLFCVSVGEYLSAKGVASQKNKTIPPNSLCVSCIGTAGVVSITAEPAQTNQQINSIVLKGLAVREFLYFALVGLREIINQYGANGATMVNLNKSKFESLRVVEAEQRVMDLFHTTAAPMFELIKTLQLKNLNLRTTRDLLLPKLISGELDVSHLPEEEAICS